MMFLQRYRQLPRWLLFFVMVLMHKQDDSCCVCAFAPVKYRNDNAAMKDRIPSGRNYLTASSLRMSLQNPIESFTTGMASLVRMPNGVSVVLTTRADHEIKILYDIENSANCRRVREKITEYNLAVSTLIPATPNSRVFQDPTDKYALSKGSTIPRMLITDKEGFGEITLNGADDIIAYLDQEYSMTKKRTPVDDDNFLKQAFNEFFGDIWEELSMILASTFRAGRGSQTSSCAITYTTKRPERQLILYSYEGNQFCRLVREVLTELDLAYELRNCGKGSTRRAELAQLTGGSTQCPYLVDPNTGKQMPESADIVKYLYKTYALWTPPNNIFEFLGVNVMPLLKPIFKILAPLQAGSGQSDKSQYELDIRKAKREIEEETESNSVVLYTYELSPFCTQATAILDDVGIPYKEVSLGLEWLPGLIDSNGGSQKRAALGEMTGQTSMPHIFVNQRSIGGLYTGTPGLIQSLQNGELSPAKIEPTSNQQTIGR